jgi:hypothetical protein
MATWIANQKHSQIPRESIGCEWISAGIPFVMTDWEGLLDLDIFKSLHLCQTRECV